MSQITKQTDKTMIYHIDFGRGALVPLKKTDLLPVGSLVTYGDMANPRSVAAIVEPTIGEYLHGQRCVFEDGHGSAVHASDVDRYGPTSAGGWHFGRDEAGRPKILNAGELAEFVRTAAKEKERRETESKIAAETKAAAKAAERTRILAAYPYLDRVGEKKKSNHALGAANLKKLLAREFPGVAFKTKSDSFSGGDSIDVSWTDGPKSDEVDHFADWFQDSDFDGMQDLSTCRDTVWPEVFGGAKYVHCHRHISDATHIKVAAELGYAVTIGQWNTIEGVDEETKQMIYREARSRSYFSRNPLQVGPTHATVHECE